MKKEPVELEGGQDQRYSPSEVTGRGQISNIVLEAVASNNDQELKEKRKWRRIEKHVLDITTRGS